ncbi:MAG: hypothetical protein R3266_15780 [Gemmatimonadota bacterium]|nr:hypothetical protein [Gemmatimonadota bacterium]
MGREGEGPGEFARLYSLAWMGDTLAALDPRNARISLLARDGTPLGQFRHQALTGDIRFIRLFQTGPRSIATPSILPVDGSIVRQFVRLRSGGVSDTVPYPPDPHESEGTRGGSIRCDYPNDSGIAFFDLPFAPRYLAVPAPGGLTATARTDEYRIQLLSAAGDTVRVVERAHDPVPTTVEAWEEGLAPFHRLKEESPGAECSPDDPARPDHRPPVNLFFFDILGRMWVEAETEAGRVWDVFDREGRHLGTVAAPPRRESNVPWADAERLYVVATDELDVPYVRVYALPPELRED